ncbi:NAD-dependent epimerase/dehydratase family protein [Halobacteriovorax sp. JY17]|uniref:NAD-dependent epimerase/dehydratase family protein n=1 Tax=Halobacteriovorax sp. JY17 TaxID=2014617 RepID=UPI000C5D607F|nr:NAD-dependent epimerase/dehydratase family protein [Halobacteriovorax sp. JY17]PIK14688.1 MAG: hypothetical protein CES88_10140 [Halobacteriovorax sp. JY17]
MMKVFVTGANGFIGRYLCRFLEKENIQVVRGTRELYGDLSPTVQWKSILSNCSSVIHLASKVHDLKKLTIEEEKEYWRINVESTVRLAEDAKNTGVKKFIFLSSVKVNGDYSNELPFSPSDDVNPSGIYGETKYAAERKLLNLSEKGVFDVIIIRPPLVYGEGAKANLKMLSNFIDRGISLPIGSINNRRSLVSIENLCSLMFAVLKSSYGVVGVFFVSDDVSYSLPEIVKSIARLKRKKVIIYPFPKVLMKFFLIMIGKKHLIDKLFGNLEVNSESTIDTFKWYPEESLTIIPPGKYFID